MSHLILAHKACGWRFLIGSPTKGFLLGPGIVLDPDPAQGFDGRDTAKPGRCISSGHGREYGYAIVPDFGRQHRTLGSGFGEPLVFEALLIAVEPLELAEGQQPIRRDNRQTVACVAQRRPNALQTIERTDGGQPVSRVGG